MATPTLPTFPPAITAVVSPAKTRTKVPNSSAAYFMRLHLLWFLTLPQTYASVLLRKRKYAQEMAAILDCKVSGQFYIGASDFGTYMCRFPGGRDSQNSLRDTQEVTAIQ